MEDKEKQNSDAIAVLEKVWQGALRVKPYSEPRLRAVMHDAMELAIKAGLSFDETDFSALIERFHLGRGYFTHCFLHADEHYYGIAVAVGNISACRSFEKACNRKPFMTDEVKTMTVHYAGHLDITRPRSRLSCGCQFIWKGERVTVTSFAKDNSYLTACSYHPHDPEKKAWEQNRKPWHIFRISHKDLKEDRNEKGLSDV